MRRSPSPERGSRRRSCGPTSCVRTGAASVGTGVGTSPWPSAWPGLWAGLVLAAQRAAVVVTLVLTEAHRVGWLLHAGQQRRQQVLLLVDQVRAVVVGQLVLVGHRQRTR